MAYFNHRTGVIVTVLVIIFLFFAVPAFAEKVTFVKEYTYQASELDSKHSCRTISLEMVKRLLLEEFGTYLISETEVKDFKLTKDQVTTYSAGIVSAEVIEEKWDGKTYWLKARVSADPKEAAKALKKIMDEPFKGKEIEETKKKAEELTKEVERLNKELAKATNKQPSKKIQQEYETAIQGLTANEWFDKGLKAGLDDRHKEAIDAFTKAIELNPDFTEAYFIRGAVYDLDLNKYQHGINDYTKAIELKPYDAKVYWFRGSAYYSLGNYQQAIKDYTKAIELKPDKTILYKLHKNRGLAYYVLRNYQQAINNYTKAIEINPQDATSYVWRGISYRRLRNIQQAIKDYTKAIEIDSKNSEAYVERGDAYSAIGFVSGDLDNYQMAIKDYTKAIEIDSKNALEAYLGRGFAHKELGNFQEAINDYIIAARLGDKTAQKYLKELGIKW